MQDDRTEPCPRCFDDYFFRSSGHCVLCKGFSFVTPEIDILYRDNFYPKDDDKLCTSLKK